MVVSPLKKESGGSGIYIVVVRSANKRRFAERTITKHRFAERTATIVYLSLGSGFRLRI